MRSSWKRGATAALALIAAPASAQPSDGLLTLQFGASAIPLDPWSSAAAAVLVAIAAGFLLRKVRGGGAIAGALAIIGLTFALMPRDLISDANAKAVPTIINVGGAPSVSVVVPGGFGFYEFVNTSSGAIIISSIAYSGPNAIVPTSNQCQVGMKLAPGGFCDEYISIPF